VIVTGSSGKVALFSFNFLPYSETFVYDEIRHHERYQVEVFTQRRLNADRFPVENPVHALSPARGFWGGAERVMFNTTTYSPTFRRLFRQGGFDLIHAHFGPTSVYGLNFQRKFRIPLVATYHGHDVPLLMTSRRFQPKHWGYWFLAGAMLKRVNRFLAASDELAAMLIELGAPPERVRVWRLGVEIPQDSTPPEPHSGPFRIIMVGRFVEKKGFEYGLSGFAKLIGQGADAELHIVGDGPLKPRYQELIAREGIGERVHFRGIMPHEQVLAEMAGMDLLLAPSVVAANGDRESGLIVVKEANARFVPAVGTQHGGIPEIIDNDRTGFLIPERDQEAIADRLIRLWSDPALRLDMGRKAREKMEREYDIRRRVAALEVHYDEVIAETRAK